jgi:hypothetical protein
LPAKLGTNPGGQYTGIVFVKVLPLRLAEALAENWIGVLNVAPLAVRRPPFWT